ncbi:hypothetical protein AB3480_00655 [Rhizobium mongolense]
MSPVDALKEIERLATKEVNQPGTNEDRFRALVRIMEFARKQIERAGA